MSKINWEINKNEVKRTIKTNKFITRILILQCTVCLTLIALVAANTLIAHTSVDQLKKFIGNKSYYTLHDKGDEDGSYQKYRDSEIEYFKLYRFVNELRQNKDIAFINTVIQPIDIVAESFPDKFGFGYEDGDYEPYQSDNEVFFPVKSIQISYNIFSEFGISVEEGRVFSQQDFILKDSDNVKVILGSEYKDYYKIGDSFKANYLCERMNFEVIGLLPPDTYIPRNGVLVYMDRYILIPAFSEIDYKEYYNLASIALMQQANGQIVTSDKDLNVPGLVKDLSEKYNTVHFHVFEAGKKEIIRDITISDEIVKKLSLIVLTLITFTVVGLTTSILGRIRENYYRYGVHLMNGAALSDISYQMIGWILYIIINALIISILVSVIITGIGRQLIIITLVALIILVLSSVVPAVSINKLDINNLIRRKE